MAQKGHINPIISGKVKITSAEFAAKYQAK